MPLYPQNVTSQEVCPNSLLFRYFHLRLTFDSIKEVGCRNPTLAKCGGEAQHLEKLGTWSPPGLPNVQSSTERSKTTRIEAFLVSLERS